MCRSKRGWYPRVLMCSILCMLLLSGICGRAQTFNFKTTALSGLLTASQIQAHGLPDTITTWCAEWPAIRANSTGFYNDFTLKSNHSYLKFYIDNYYPKVQKGYTYLITYQMYGHASPTDTNLTELTSDTLRISNLDYFTHDFHNAYQDIDMAKFSNYLKTMVVITGIYDYNGGSPIPADLTDTLKWNFNIESSILTQRYEKTHSGTSYYGAGSSLETTELDSSANNYLAVYFNYATGDTTPLQLTPVNFELEWTYVDDYKVDPFAPSVSHFSMADLNYDFRNNSTRVVLKDSKYRIPIVYPNGYIIYRVRMVRPDSVNFASPIYSDWSFAIPDSGAISSVDGNAVFYISNPYTGDQLNWQYTISFAEGGKSKHVVGFYDGLLKNRESITRFNSRPDRLIATRNIYDYEGHPAIKILPTPVPSSSLSYVYDLDLNSATGNPYQAKDFDTALSSCPNSAFLSPLSPTALASVYYSSNNPDTGGVQQFVPDAGGYPMVQTEFSPAYNDRVDKQGGAGPRLQIHDSNIITNYYVGAEQMPLNRLFGLNIGWKGFYNKTVTRDPNMQLSKVVKDYHGKQVMTAMIGRGGDPAKLAINPVDAPDSTRYKEDVLTGVTQTIDGATRSADFGFFNEAEGMDSLQYVYKFSPYPVCPGQYLSVKAHFDYQLTDQCGDTLLTQDSTLGVTGVVSAPVAFAGTVEGVHVGQANYYVHKDLSVSFDDIDAALDSLFDGPNCFLGEPYFVRKSVERASFPCPGISTDPCEVARLQMLQDLHPNAKYGHYHYVSGAVVGDSNSVFTRHLVSTNTGAIYVYRYQDTCTVFSLPDSMMIGDSMYHHLRTMRADSFLAIYTMSTLVPGDPIATALLPLHPEYCEWLRCFHDTFRTTLLALPDAHVAESQHLLYLDSIVAHDPFVAWSGVTNITDSLTHYPGGHLRLDSIELLTDYCGCGDSVMDRVCINSIFNYEIQNKLLINDFVKGRYFNNMISLYVQNRQRFVNAVMAVGGDSCWHCALVRMHLVPSPLFDTPLYVGSMPPPTIIDSAWAASSHTSWLISAISSFTAMDSLSDSAMVALADSAGLVYGATDSIICFGQVDSIIAHLANCGGADTTTLIGIRNTLDSFCAVHAIHGGAYTPDIIRYAILRNGAHLTDFCNEWLVSYVSLLPPVNNVEDCKSDSFFSSVAYFMSDTQVLSTLRYPGTVHLDTLNILGNEFANNLWGSLGSTYVSLLSSWDAPHSLYALKVFPTAGGADTVTVYLRGTGSCGHVFGMGDSTDVIDVSCINTLTSPVANGLIAKYSFVMDVLWYSTDVTTGLVSATACSLLGWTDSVETMNDKPQIHALCVPCTQMRELYNQFNDSLQVLGITGTDHPVYEMMLENFMDRHIGHMYTVDQYERFIQSCSLADSVPMPLYVGYSNLRFSDTTALDSFLAMLNNVDTNYLFTDMYHHIDPDGTVLLSVDYNVMPFSELWKYKQAIEAYSGLYTVNVSDTTLGYLWGSNVLGFFYMPDGDTPPTSAVYGGGSVSIVDSGDKFVWTGDIYQQQHYYYILGTPGTTTPYEISKDLYEIQAYAYNNSLDLTMVPFYMSTVNEDYFKPKKQDYLRYTYGYEQLPSYRVLDSVQADELISRVSSYSGSQASYYNPYNPNVVTNLYVADTAGNTPYYDTLVYILQNVADSNLVSPGHICFDTNMVKVRTDSALFAFRCSDGTFWYRYFGGGDTLWNVYLAMPAWLPYHQFTHSHMLSLGGIRTSLGDSNSRFFTLVMQHDADTGTFVARGMTTFVIGHQQVLRDVLLGNPITGYSGAVPADSFNNCERDRLRNAVAQGVIDYDHYIDSLKDAVRAGFMAWMLDSVQEHLYLSYLNQEFVVTLYYYDRAGNLVSTVSPGGVVPLAMTALDSVDTARFNQVYDPTLVNHHNKVSSYNYNSYNHVVSQTTPDGGTTNFYYNAAGMLIFSQNAKQSAQGLCTYTLYDHQNRVTETGQAAGLTCGSYFDTYMASVGDTVPPCSWVYSDTGTHELVSALSPPVYRVLAMPMDSIRMYIDSLDRTDVVMTIYDSAARDLGQIPGMDRQDNLRKRVAAIKYFDTLNHADTLYYGYTYATHYNYDCDGNVKTLTQDFPELAGRGQRYKRIDYDYDLISGKVNMVSYDRSFADQYYQRYSYDDDNRITKVETSNDGDIWQRDAEYTYYQHGPLARIETGDLRVQGIDYAYTIQGWLKVVNADTLQPKMDMGQDAYATVNANDAVAYSIDYFKDDYKPVTAWPLAHTTPDSLSLYNGNISRQTMALANYQRLSKQYIYDQLNRIKRNDNSYISAVDYSLGGTREYYNDYSYDLDGNLLTLNRNGNLRDGPSTNWTDPALERKVNMDRFTYVYGMPGYTPNELYALGDSAYQDYVIDVHRHELPSPIVATYMYDQIGNTVKDLVSGQDTITWNLYNKVTGTRHGSDTVRLCGRKPWYSLEYDDVIRDTARAYVGNVMQDRMEETHITAQKQYELTDHLGNVLATLSDAREPVASDTCNIDSYKPVIKSEQDYYPFGMMMPGRYSQDTSNHCALFSETVLVPAHNSITHVWPDGLAAHVGSSSFTTGASPMTLTSTNIGDGLTYTIACTPGITQTVKIVVATPGVFFLPATFKATVIGAMSSTSTYLYNFGPGGYLISYTPTSTTVTLQIIYSAGSFLHAPINISKIITDSISYASQNVLSLVCNEDQYHYGFNGKLKDNEWAGLGNHLDFGARGVDSRVARFSVIDPLSRKFPDQSPYLFAGNST